MGDTEEQLGRYAINITAQQRSATFRAFADNEDELIDILFRYAHKTNGRAVNFYMYSPAPRLADPDETPASRPGWGFRITIASGTLQVPRVSV